MKSVEYLEEYFLRSLLVGKKLYVVYYQDIYHHLVKLQKIIAIVVLGTVNELLEKLEEGQKFMTTSCCPSYIELVNKHIPDMKPYVSSTGSPMYYAAAGK